MTISTDKCLNCGADNGLHRYDDLACPRGGIEASVGREMLWDRTHFEIDSPLKSLEAQLKIATEALEYYYRMRAVCQHDDSSWCDYCPDAGKTARKALAAIKEES